MVRGVARLLPRRLLGGETPRPVLRAGDVVDAHLVHQRRVLPSVDGGMDKRSSPAPVLVGRVRVEDLGEKLRWDVVEQSLAQTGFRIGLRHVGKRKDVGGMKEIDVGMSVARSLRETMIEATPSSTRDMSQNAVQNPPVSLVFVEPVVEKGSEEAAALRNAEGQAALYRPSGNSESLGRAVLQVGKDVPNPRRPETHHPRFCRYVDDLVDLEGLEPIFQIDPGRIVNGLPVRQPGESPLGARDFPSGCLDAVADGQDVLPSSRIGHWTGRAAGALP